MTTRRDREERRLAALQSAYRALLVPALRACAGGRLGLLGRAAHLTNRTLAAPLEAPEWEELGPLGDTVATLRDRLGYHDPFPLHARLLAERGGWGPDAAGEPERAAAWLAELAEG